MYLHTYISLLLRLTIGIRCTIHNKPNRLYAHVSRSKPISALVDIIIIINNNIMITTFISSTL